MSPPQPRLWLGECMEIYNFVVEQSMKIYCLLFKRSYDLEIGRNLNGMKCIKDKGPVEGPKKHFSHLYIF